MPGLGLERARRSAAIYRLRREFIDNDDVVITVGLTSGYEAHQLGRLLNLSRGEARRLDRVGARLPEGANVRRIH
jgi:hypothetical protein